MKHGKDHCEPHDASGCKQAQVRLALVVLAPAEATIDGSPPCASSPRTHLTLSLGESSRNSCIVRIHSTSEPSIQGLVYFHRSRNMNAVVNTLQSPLPQAQGLSDCSLNQITPIDCTSNSTSRGRSSASDVSRACASAAGFAETEGDQNERGGHQHPARMAPARPPKIAERAIQVGAADEQAGREPGVLLKPECRGDQSRQRGATAGFRRALVRGWLHAGGAAWDESANQILVRRAIRSRVAAN